MFPPDASFRALFEQAPFSIQLLAPDGRTLAVNQAWRDIWQLPDDFIQSHILTRYNILEDPLLEKQGATAEIRKAVAGGTGHIPPFPYDPRALGFPGRRRVMGATVFPLKDAEGRVTHVVLAHRDVTAEVESEERLEDALDAGRMAVWELDLATGVVRRSAHHDRLYGYADPLPAWSLDDFVSHLHPEDRPDMQRDFAAMLDGSKDSYARDFRVVWPDGQVRWMTSRARFLRAADGKPQKLLGTLVDVTRLKEAVRARDEFLSLASHELRTPLTSLLLHAQRTRRALAREAVPPTVEKLQALALQQQRQVERLARLVDDLLDISRLSTGRLVMQPETTDLAKMVDEVVSRMEPQLEDAQCTLVTRIQRPVTGSWDPFRLEQVLVNLLSNAARYGRGAPVEVELVADEREARLSVRDHGPGIDPRHHLRIFERFERAVAANDHGGLGLGLYISREIVQQHGGTITVDSTPGQGATFQVTLRRT